MHKKKNKNTKKDLKKKLKVYMQERYLKILRYLNSSAADAEKNVWNLIKYEPEFYATIQQIDVTKQIHKKETEFWQAVNLSGNETDFYLKDIRAKQVLVQEVINQTMNMKALSPKTVRYKETRIKNLEEKLKKLKMTEQLLIEANAELAELDKRPRGRPRKDDTELEYDLEDEEQYAEEE